MSFTSKVSAFFLIILAGISQETYGQRFYSVVFNKLPKDMQLFARDDNNVAEVPFAGKIEATGWDHMSVVTFRNGKQVGLQQQKLDYAGQNFANFELKPKIKAEMADYDFAVYVCKTDDSVLIVKRTEIVAGDFYVISGQSNAAAVHFGDWSSKYARTLGRTPDDSPAQTLGDTMWIPSSWSWPYAGAWGVEMQRRILEKDSIPTCVINGALPGSYIRYHTDRNAENPASSNLYGFLYQRIKAARAGRIRAFFWYQGEQEALEDIRNYEQEYDKLFKYWQQDYPQVDKFVVMQIPVLFNPYYVAGTIREFQRKTKYIYPKTDHFNVNGLPGFDGIHYSLSGYQELGKRVYNFVKPKVYGSADSSNVNCPDVQQIYYSSEQKDEITLVFEEGQSLRWPKDTLIDDVSGAKFLKGLKDVIYFDGDESKPASIASGSANGNRVILKLSGASNAGKLTYLPAYKGEQIRIYYGPFLTNARGLGAFSFQEFPIANIITFPVFEAKESELASVRVSWQSSGADRYVLEKKGPDDTDFKTIDTFNGTTLSYEDKDVSPDETYSYRIQAFSKTSQSLVKTTSVKMLPLLAVKQEPGEMFWKIYPNPVSAALKVEFRNPVKGEIRLSNARGQLVHNAHLKSENRYEVDISTMPTGLYILTVAQGDGTTISSKIIKQ
ncbi:T9SS type A sorting domain-containing protein [Dyadobacter sp.]|uniref:T9SS type A sorting domain-containing protein n=1 Tax=Dyadobacter sp. TaxID=1914288 RepID=UPI003F6FCA02